jgi:hypothetical protein
MGRPNKNMLIEIADNIYFAQDNMDKNIRNILRLSKERESLRTECKW